MEGQGAQAQNANNSSEINTPNSNYVIIFRDKTDGLFYAKLPDGTVVSIGGAGAVPTLAQVLAIGNITGANNIIISDGDSIEPPDGNTKLIFNPFGVGNFGYDLRFDDGSGKVASFTIRENAGLVFYTIVMQLFDGGVGGSVQIDLTSLQISHTQQIAFNSPLYSYGASMQSFADDAAAGIGGLVAGDMYQTTGAGAAPLNVAGIVMLKQ